MINRYFILILLTVTVFTACANGQPESQSTDENDAIVEDNVDASSVNDEATRELIDSENNEMVEPDVNISLGKYGVYKIKNENVYFQDTFLAEFDPLTFEILLEDPSGFMFIAKDKTKVIINDRILSGADSATYKIFSFHFQLDKNNVYNWEDVLVNSDPSSFESFDFTNTCHNYTKESEYARDERNVYYRSQFINLKPENVQIECFCLNDKYIILAYDELDVFLEGKSLNTSFKELKIDLKDSGMIQIYRTNENSELLLEV